jgi:ABC-type branched-subunit amino acid transport system permease subunit
VWVGITVGTQGALSVAAAGAFAIGAYRIFRNPPPPNDDAGNPSGINFGH